MTQPRFADPNAAYRSLTLVTANDWPTLCASHPAKDWLMATGFEAGLGELRLIPGPEGVAAAIAAEIGTMKVTEQIDALTTLATNPIKYLVAPRIVAAVVSMPILTLIGDSIGVMGGYVVSVYSLDFNGSAYLKNTWDFSHNDDITSGLIKAAVFGFIVALMGCYNGFNSKGGAQGVGNATTYAVVSSSILILAADYVLTALLFHK